MTLIRNTGDIERRVFLFRKAADESPRIFGFLTSEK